MTRAILRLPLQGTLPPFTGATRWLNSPPLTPVDLRGNVVLVSFWTYTCINWLRTLPYIRAWETKYKARGLLVLGVHTPEFAFEHDIDNVSKAIKRNRIVYPVVVDNEYAIWSAFDNHYWPALYFVDAEGRIRYNQFGEGEYEMSERVIQQLLAEAGAEDGSNTLVSVQSRGAEVPADWDDVESPETYLGYGRSWNFASPGGAASGKQYNYEKPATLRLNQWALSGSWAVGKQAVVLQASNGQIIYRFHARDLNLVMGPAKRGTEVKFRIRIDQQPPHAAHGVDVDAQGNGTVADQRVYQLVRQPQPIIDRTFEIEFLTPSVEALAFTFG